MKPQGKALNLEGPLFRGMVFGENLSPELPVGGQKVILVGGSVDPWSTSTELDGKIMASELPDALAQESRTSLGQDISWNCLAGTRCG